MNREKIDLLHADRVVPTINCNVCQTRYEDIELKDGSMLIVCPQCQVIYRCPNK